MFLYVVGASFYLFPLTFSWVKLKRRRSHPCTMDIQLQIKGTRCRKRNGRRWQILVGTFVTAIWVTNLAQPRRFHFLPILNFNWIKGWKTLLKKFLGYVFLCVLNVLWTKSLTQNKFALRNCLQWRPAAKGAIKQWDDTDPLLHCQHIYFFYELDDPCILIKVWAKDRLQSLRYLSTKTKTT